MLVGSVYSQKISKDISGQYPYACINTLLTLLSNVPSFTTKLTNSMKSITGLVNTMFTAGILTVFSIGLHTT